MDYNTCILKTIDSFAKILLKRRSGKNKLLKVVTKELDTKREKTNVRLNSQAAENEKQAIQSGKLKVFITDMSLYSYKA